MPRIERPEHIIDRLSELEERATILQLVLGSDTLEWSVEKIRSAVRQQAFDVVNNIREIIEMEEARAE